MNDEDIKKGLECCLIGECEGCPISKFSDCYEKLKDEVMSLINRQQAEIERLENAIIALMSYLDTLGADKTDTSFINQATESNKQIRADIKAEAIKECVNKYTEMLIDEYHLRTDFQIASIKRVAKKLLAEMVGGKNA